MARQAAAVTDTGVSAWYTRSPGVEIISGVRAILPLVIFLFFVLSVILRERLANQAEIFLGIAEPALSALGLTAEELTNGIFKKKTLIMAVSIGVACGIALGLAKLIFNLPLVWLLVGTYTVAAMRPSK